MRVAALASFVRFFMFTPFFLTKAVFLLVVLSNVLTNHASALITQSACVITGWVMLLCMKVTVSDSLSALVSFINMLCVR